MKSPPFHLMPVLLSCHNLAKSYGARLLFADLTLTLSDGERLGLIGPNGSGKTTLMEILAGRKTPDRGLFALRKQARPGYVPQDSVFPPGATVAGELRQAVAALPLEEDERTARVAIMLGRAGFPDAAAEAAALSGGWKKRLAIAREWIREPDVLLLDEPTNHLDLAGILWLEQLLADSRMACLVISHDRYFLENTTTSMAEINRVYPEGIFRVEGNYTRFLERREEFLEAQSKRREALATKVRREVEWMRRGPKARTGKSRARIGSAERLIGELAEADGRNRTSAVQIDLAASGRRTKRLVAVEGVEKSMGGRTLFRNLNLTLAPGVRLGLVGANGSGKTTLLKLIAGELAPDAGVITRAGALRAVSFAQDRTHLDPQLSLRRALCPEGDSVVFRGHVQHVAGWARRFLFHSEQMELAVGSLSGGERARVLIARLMLEEADVLLLDEPTNDLDIPTLEVLEENLADFPGALVLVTHDRYLLDRVSTAVLGLGEGGAELFACYAQWEDSRQLVGEKSGRQPAQQRETSPRKKLSYLDQREWEGMEARILEAEQALAAHQAAMQEPDCVSNAGLLQQRYGQVQEAQARVDGLYARWAELEGKLG